MKRDILFRGKRISDNAWIYGYYDMDMSNGKEYIHVQHYAPPTFSDPGGECFSEYFEVFPGTVGQLWIKTNGMELFEGDKVLVQGTKRIGEYETYVVFEDHMFKLKENKTRFIDGKEFFYVKQVIGNIHE